MTTKKAQLKRIQKIVIPLLRRNKVIQAGIFGSYARGEAKKRSDVDLLVKFRRTRSLLDIAGMELERYCCRGLFLGHLDLIDATAEFKRS